MTKKLKSQLHAALSNMGWEFDTQLQKLSSSQYDHMCNMLMSADMAYKYVEGANAL